MLFQLFYLVAIMQTRSKDKRIAQTWWISPNRSVCSMHRSGYSLTTGPAGFQPGSVGSFRGHLVTGQLATFQPLAFRMENWKGQKNPFQGAKIAAPGQIIFSIIFLNVYSVFLCAVTTILAQCTFCNIIFGPVITPNIQTFQDILMLTIVLVTSCCRTCTFCYFVTTLSIICTMARASCRPC